MRGSQGVLAAAANAIAIASLVVGAASFAQEDDLEEKKEVLENALERRATGNTDAAATQEQIDEISDETDSLLGQYRAALKQIDSIRIYNDQMRQLIASQEAEVAALADQLGRVELVGRSVTPLMLRMIESLEKFVALDVPFLLEEREKRVGELRSVMNRADVTAAEKYRQIMEAYQIENEFGRTIEAYRGTIDLDGRETTVDFLRFGRIALVYQSLDETASGVWDQTTRSWMPLDSSYRSSIRNGLRIARKQSAPDLIRLPLQAGRKARGS